MTKPARSALLISLLLSAGTLATFWPVLQNGFVNYEDTLYVTQNPHVLSGLTLGNLSWAFGTAYYDYWHPLAWVSHMADMELFGLNPGMHHLTSLLIHLANTLLLFWLLQRMTGAVWRSGMVAALFAMHPLHVESVAWVTERKDVLSTLFFMLTLGAYLRYVEVRGEGAEWRAERGATNIQHPTSHIEHPTSGTSQPTSGSQDARARTGWYLLALLLYAFGLASKPMLVTVPFVLLVLDYWPLRRLGGLESEVQSLKSKGVHAPQPGGGRATASESGRRTTDYGPRGKGVWAPKAQIVNRILEKVPFLVLAVVASAATFCIQRRVGAMDTLASVGLGDRLANAVVSYMRYLGKMVWPARLAIFYPYPPTLPSWEWVLAGAALGGLTLAAVWLARSRPYVLAGWLWFLGTLVPVIGLVQVGEQAMADRYSYVPLIGLFVMLVWAGHDIATHWRRGATVAGAVAALLLVVLAALAHRQAAYWRTSATLFAHAIAVTDSNSVAENNLGTALVEQGDWAQAGRHFAEALRLRPSLQMARINCALALAHQDKAEAAIREIAGVTQAIGAAGHRVLAETFLEQGKVNEAITQYLAAVRGDPTNAAVREQLGLTLGKAGRTVEASEQFAELVRLQPDAEAHYHLALSLVLLGQSRSAVEHYREAIRLNPDWPEPLNDLAWLLATSSNAEVRNGTEAVRLAEHACELSGRAEARFLGTLDAAYAEAGRFGEAITVAEQARKMALAADDQGLADAAAARLELYRTGRAYHQP